MSKGAFETKSLVYIVAVCYAGNLLFGWIGAACPPNSAGQLVLYQVGNAFAISGSVMAGRYTGLRGQHVAASAFILLGITHGISLGAVNRTSLNIDRGMTIVMPMIPALVFMFWCDLFPKWVRAAGLIPSVCFTLVYIHVRRGEDFYTLPLQAGYATLHLLEVVWSIFLFKDWKRSSSSG